MVHRISTDSGFSSQKFMHLVPCAVDLSLHFIFHKKISPLHLQLLSMTAAIASLAVIRLPTRAKFLAGMIYCAYKAARYFFNARCKPSSDELRRTGTVLPPAMLKEDGAAAGASELQSIPFENAFSASPAPSALAAEQPLPYENSSSISPELEAQVRKCKKWFQKKGDKGKWLGLRGVSVTGIDPRTNKTLLEQEIEALKKGFEFRSVRPAGYSHSYLKVGLIVKIKESNIASARITVEDPFFPSVVHDVRPCIWAEEIITGYGTRLLTNRVVEIRLRRNSGYAEGFDFTPILTLKEFKERKEKQIANGGVKNGDEVILQTLTTVDVMGIFFSPTGSGDNSNPLEQARTMQNRFQAEGFGLLPIFRYNVGDIEPVL